MVLYYKAVFTAPIRILVIDDSETEFFFIKELFARNNPEEYIFEWEPKPEKALEEMQKNSYDVFFVDYQLGVTTGMELIHDAKQAGCVAPIILITGFGHREIDLEAQKVGVDDYLVKSDLTYRYVDKSIRYALERKKNENTAFENQLKMSHALKMSALGEMSSGIAHEINNPLAIISALASVLLIKAKKVEDTDPYFIESLNKVIKMCERISKIISGLGAFSRDEKSDAIEPVVVGKLIEESIHLCHGKLAHNGVRLVIDEVKIASVVKCRSGEMMQVMVNLINNAADAVSGMPDPWVKVSAEVAGKDLLIHVMDSGPGIPEDIRKKILQPYYTTKSRGKGTGLGLSISKVIVEAHSGDLYIDDQQENTCFTVRLPLMPPQEKGTVLVVDNDEEIQNQLSQFLESQNYNVLLSSSAEEAMKVLTRESVDYAFVEYDLPVVNGLALAEQILKKSKEGGSETRLTLMARHRPIVIPKDLPANVIYKPFKMEQVQACLGGIENSDSNSTTVGGIANSD